MGAALFMMAQDGEDGQDGRPGFAGPTGPTGATGATGASGSGGGGSSAILVFEADYVDAPDFSQQNVPNFFPVGFTAPNGTLVTTDNFTAGSSDLTGNVGSQNVQIVFPVLSSISRFIYQAQTAGGLVIYPGGSPGVTLGQIDACNIGANAAGTGQFTQLTAILSASFQSGFTSSAGSSVTGGFTTDTLSVTSTSTLTGLATFSGGASVTGGTSTDTLSVTSTSTYTGLATFNGGASHAAGTTTVAPIKLTSGTNLTTPAAGAIEYDGKLKYFTPAGTARGLQEVTYLWVNPTARTLSNATGNQIILGTATGTGLTSGVVLQASTVYFVEGEFQLTTAGTTAHTESFGFVLTTATVSYAGYTVDRFTNGTTAASPYSQWFTTVTPSVVTASITSNQTSNYRIRGVIAITTGGSLNPVIALSAAPGTSVSIATGAWFKFTPVGTTGSNVNIGTWA